MFSWSVRAGRYSIDRESTLATVKWCKFSVKMFRRKTGTGTSVAYVRDENVADTLREARTNADVEVKYFWYYSHELPHIITAITASSTCISECSGTRRCSNNSFCDAHFICPLYKFGSERCASGFSLGRHCYCKSELGAATDLLNGHSGSSACSAFISNEFLWNTQNEW